MIDTIEVADNESEDKTEEVIVQKYSRRLIIVTGDKGGVGKSTFARGLVQTYIDNQRKFVGFDADLSNSQLVRFYGKHSTIEPLDIFRHGTIDQFFNKLKKMVEPEANEEGHTPQPESLFLLELPPQSRRILKEFVQQMSFLETAQKEYDIRVTMVIVISRVVDSINQLLDLYDFCGNKVDYVVVRNLFFGEEDEFTRYEKSPGVKEIKDQLKIERIPFVDITMPELIEHAYDYLDEKSKTFREGIEQRDLPAVKGRVTSWLRNFKEQIKPVKGLLGLDDVEIS